MTTRPVENLARSGALDELGGGEQGWRRLLWKLGVPDYCEEALDLEVAVEPVALADLLKPGS